MAEPARNLPSPATQANWKSQLDLSRLMEMNKQAVANDNAAAFGSEESLGMAPADFGGAQPANDNTMLPPEEAEQSLPQMQAQPQQAAVQPEAPPDEDGRGDPVARAKAKAAERSMAAAGGSPEAALAGALAGGELPSGPEGYKLIIDKAVWPLVLDPTGIAVGIEALTFLQLYWISSMMDFPGTVKMKLWEHVVLGCLTILAIMLILLVTVAGLFCMCMLMPACSMYIGYQAFLSIF